MQTEAERIAVPENALAAVVDNATALARAEVRLVVAEAKAWLTRAAAGLVLLWLLLLLLQVCALAVAFAPLAWRQYPPSSVLGALALAALPALVVFACVMRELRRLKAPQDASVQPDQPPRH